jgi:hypothetical protein
VAADDDDAATTAPVHELRVLFDDPYDSPDKGLQSSRVFDVVAREYAVRGGRAVKGAVLPEPSDHRSDGVDPDDIPYGGGRADIRFAVDREQELYLLSKSDGMIRAFRSAARVAR